MDHNHKKSGYSDKLKFEPPNSNPRPKKRGRKRHILWFNPPFNSTVRTNVAREFLTLIDQCFPPGNPLKKIFNRNTVKVAYSTTPNMAQIIAGKNASVLKGKEDPKRECSCPKGKTCPLDKKCLSENIIYQATVTQPNNETKTYVGLTSTDFKQKLGVHRQNFKDLTTSQTSLSKHIWDLKSKNIEPTITWKIIDRGRPFSPTHGVCQLCNKEKFYILFKPEMAELNSKSETFSACRHVKSALLIKKIRKSSKKSPGN